MREESPLLESSSASSLEQRVGVSKISITIIYIHHKDALCLLISNGALNINGFYLANTQIFSLLT